MQQQHRIQNVLQTAVDNGSLAGAVAAVWRDGRLEIACAGWRHIEGRLPMERNTIFRIASMTKPVTSVAALMLIDEGRFALHDPISKFAPEFSRMRVLTSPDGPLDETEPAARPITFEDLLTHRAGFTYGDFHRGPIAQAYYEALGPDIDSPVVPAEWMRRLAALPLIGQPGSAMFYGKSTDLLGFLIARIEGAPLGAVLRRRIFDPLGMTDTGFAVPPENRPRRAAAYGFDDAGRLIQRDTWGSLLGNVVVAERPPEMTYESGSGGLWSTVEDYVKFARLFLGNGAVDGVRLLHPETLANMMRNQLTASQNTHPAWMALKPGRGFGLGVSVVLQSNQADFLCRGSVGTVSWPGAFGGWWHADPKEQSVLVFLAHNMVNLEQMAKGIGLAVWATIEGFQSAALVSGQQLASPSKPSAN